MGNFLSLIGLGISASYERQEDALQGSLVQSVYMSGFQDDSEGDDTTDEASRVNQRFGWYYNAAPFDQYVTPGIRSTYAIVTVPRNSVVGRPVQPPQFPACEGIRNIQSRVEPAIFLCVNANWVKRDSPLYQKPHWYSKTYLRNGPYSTTHKSIRLPLPETEGLRTPPVNGERDRLHVLRMEYNPVYYTKYDFEAATALAHPPSLLALPAPLSAPVQSSIQRNGCWKDECASVLLTLDVPIDPNLVVSVRGTPLHRVRDWRGRATSVLPPAQSGSDLPPPASAGGIQVKGQSPVSRSLLESDQAEPDSWFAVSSHGLLLNISRDLAGEEEFPSIQISDPARRTLLIPNDLKQNYSEIITNGFRFLPSSQIARHIEINFFSRIDSAEANPFGMRQDAARGLGVPHLLATYLPPFLPHP